MPIPMKCDCGASFGVPDEYAGRLVRCPACGNTLAVVAPDFGTDASFRTSDTPVPPARATAPDAPRWTARYWLLALALIPLLWSSFHPEKNDVQERMQATVRYQMEHGSAENRAHAAEALQKLQDEDLDGFFEALPGHKLQGALFPRNTSMHWVIALFASVVFWVTIIVLFPSHLATPGSLVLTGLFTATLGIVLLLFVQTVALYAPIIRGGGIIMVISLILKLIGWSYMAAEDPENGFLLSLFGFTFGVGLCEELCKLLPVFYVVRTRAIDWRAACILGLASGIGFGVSEGIMYSGRSYNGILGADIYLIRFASCVVLHAVWAAAASISLWKNQDELESGNGGLEIFFRLVWIAFAPMMLHGLYDTLLKHGDDLIAAGVALLSFAWLAYTIEGVRKNDEPATEATAG